MHNWILEHYDALRDLATPVLAIIGFCITIGIAVGGFRTFGRWKRERIEERRIEVALDALAIAYEAKFRFQTIRSRRVLESEWEDIDETRGNVEFPLPSRREGQRSPYAVLKRIDRAEEFFERVSKIEPKFMAIFGRETEAIFAILYGAKLRVETAAESLFEECSFEHGPSDMEARERMRKLRVDIFASADDAKPEDVVVQNVLEFQKRIEELCRPDRPECGEGQARLYVVVFW